MSRMSLLLSLLVVLTLFQSSHGASCACEAENTGFSINCEDPDAMVNALAMLQSNGCQTDCTSSTCSRNFLVIQSHHDYCLEGQVPETVEEGLHDYEDACEECDITPLPDPNLPTCPDVNCKVDGEGNAAYQALLSEGCLADCSSQSCGDNYRILNAAHDLCPEDSLTPEAEEGLHDLGEPCASQGCNVVFENAPDPLVCQETAGTSDAALIAHRSLFTTLGVAALMAAVF